MNFIRNLSSVIILAAGIALSLHFLNLSRGPRNTLKLGDAAPKELAILSPETVVIVVSESSRFCRASLEFHRRVIEASHAAGMPVTVALDRRGPGTLELLRALAADDKVVQVDLESLRLGATPTLVLIYHGKIAGKWIGQMDSSQETLILMRLNGHFHTLSRIDPTDIARIADIVMFPASEIEARLSGAIILDVRPRAEFGARPHMDSSINIPADEVAMRSVVDLPLPSDKPRIIIDCSAINEGPCRVVSIGLSKAGFNDVWSYDLDSQGATCQNNPTGR